MRILSQQAGSMVHTKAKFSELIASHFAPLTLIATPIASHFAPLIPLES